MMTPNQVLNWAVATGCYRLSPGCNSCPSYWEHLEAGKDYSPVEHPEILDEPLMNPQASHYEVAFGSDLFHLDVTLEFQRRVFEVMNKAHWHTFSVGTKRIKRLSTLRMNFEWTDNIWVTVPVESSDYEWRIDILKTLPAKKKVISIVPMLGAFSQNVNFRGIDIVGAVPETWGYKRPCDPRWIEHIRKACIRDDVPFGMDHVVYETEKDKKYAIRQG